jgi:hypothetical protein
MHGMISIKNLEVSNLFFNRHVLKNGLCARYVDTLFIRMKDKSQSVVLFFSLIRCTYSL